MNAYYWKNYISCAERFYGCFLFPNLMLELIGIIGFISELVIAFAGFAITYFTLKKDSKSIPHRLLALSTLLIGVYGVSIFIYDVTGIEILVLILLRLGTVALFFGVVFLYFTFQVIVHTKDWLGRRLNTLPLIIGVSIYALVFFVWDGAVTIINPTPPVDSKIDITMTIILGVSILLLLLATMFNLYRFGIKPSEGDKRQKMTIALVGFLFCLAALFLNIASTLAAEGSLFDIAFFLILAGGMAVIAYGFIGPSRR